MFDNFAKLFGYVSHRKSSEMGACHQYRFKSEELRPLQAGTSAPLYVTLGLSMAHHNKRVALCQLSPIQFFE